MCNIDKSTESHQQFTHGIQLAALQELLTDAEIELICRQVGHTWRNRILTPTRCGQGLPLILKTAGAIYTH